MVEINTRSFDLLDCNSNTSEFCINKIEKEIYNFCHLALDFAKSNQGADNIELSDLFKKTKLLQTDVLHQKQNLER